MRRYPLCWGCTEEVDTDPLYEAPCGHDEDCPTAVWHPACLVKWREHRDEAIQSIQRWASEHEEFWVAEINLN